MAEKPLTADDFNRNLDERRTEVRKRLESEAQSGAFGKGVGGAILGGLIGSLIGQAGHAGAERVAAIEEMAKALFETNPLRDGKRADWMDLESLVEANKDGYRKQANAILDMDSMKRMRQARRQESVDETRETMHAWLVDMEALSPFANSENGNEFKHAYAMAKDKARAAAAAYVVVIEPK